jgi:mono/diheme cytochrome c family protein
MSSATLRGRNRPLTHLARFGLLLVAALFIGACHLDMYQQPKNRPLSSSDFFPDGSSARPLLANTVARNQAVPDARTTGKQDGTGDFVTDIPLEVTPALIARGQERFTIYCSSCHGAKADGKGTVSGLLKPPPPSFFDQRIVDMPNGYYFDVISNGKGAMFQYRSRIQNPDDRWAIIAYIREAQKTPPPPPPTPKPTVQPTAQPAP